MSSSTNRKQPRDIKNRPVAVKGKLDKEGMDKQFGINRYIENVCEQGPTVSRGNYINYPVIKIMEINKRMHIYVIEIHCTVMQK